MSVPLIVPLISPRARPGGREHLYAKLGAHSRAEAVETARAQGLLAPSPAKR